MFQYRQCKKLLFGLTCILVLLHLGCTINSNVITNDFGEIPDPLIEPLLLNVGIYYADDFRNYRSVQTNFLGTGELIVIEEVELGQANVALFDFLLKTSFDNVAEKNSISELTKSINNFDLIIIPAISKFSLNCGSLLGGCSVSLTYDIKMLLPNGNFLKAWQLSTFSAPKKSFYGFSHSKLCVEVTKEAMRDLAAIYFSEFRNQITIDKHF